MNQQCAAPHGWHGAKAMSHLRQVAVKMTTLQSMEETRTQVSALLQLARAGYLPASRVLGLSVETGSVNGALCFVVRASDSDLSAAIAPGENMCRCGRSALGTAETTAHTCTFHSFI